ncbi:ribonuclease HI [Moorella naiadis]|uniref:ribonuclease HI n=1 Tax=Moorella naiadis (nom. illeg.) TaxID=3093670 RepID=UPI003D9C9E08
MIIVNCDGLCEPVNPGGTACYGWVARKDGEKLKESWGVICSGPGATNNVAEYTAVIEAMKWLIENGFAKERIEIRSDSQLCIYQLTGDYAVRSARIKPLYREARKLAQKFSSLRFRWVPREENEEADELSRKAYAESAAPDKKRLAKAEKLVKNVEEVGGGRYHVLSSTGKSKYVVDLAALACTCPDFQKRGIKCKHIIAAEIFAAKKGELADAL